LFYPLETFFVHLNCSGLPAHETEKKAALGGDKKRQFVVYSVRVDGKTGHKTKIILLAFR